MNSAAISAVGHYLPEFIADNEFVGKRYKQSADFIYRRCGIKERRFVQEENTSDLVVKAIQNLSDRYNIDLSTIDGLIVGTATPESYGPSTAAIVMKKLNIKNAFGFDIAAACPSFCYGLEIGKLYIQTGQAKNVLVCGAEVLSRALNDFDYATGILFGDGAGVVLLSATDDPHCILNTKSKLNPEFMEDIVFYTKFSKNVIEEPELKINGTRVYRHGINYTVNFIKDYLQENNLDIQIFDKFILHQANSRIIGEIASALNVDKSKFLSNIEFVGNTASASIPICFSESISSQSIKKYERVLFCSFGAGYTLSLTDFVNGL